MNLPVSVAALCRFEFESILADPNKLGIFLELADLIRELEPRAREAAIKSGLVGKVVPGQSVVRRDGARYVLPEAVLALLDNCSDKELRAVLPSILRAYGHISEGRYRALCSYLEVDPDPAAIQRTGVKVFLRSKTNY